jgi:autotransporter-associated beta strand protein
MNYSRPSLLALLCGTLLLSSPAAHAASGTWLLDPISNDWNTAGNWSPPNVPTDLAEFAASNLTNLSFSVPDTTSVSEILFHIGASAYTFTLVPGQTLSVQGDGIINSSGATQTFDMLTDDAGNYAGLSFDGGFVVELAGTDMMFTNHGGRVSGGHGSYTSFGFRVDAGDATVINMGGEVSGATGGELDLYQATASSATITNKAGSAGGALGGTTIFWFPSLGGNSVITSEGAAAGEAAGGVTVFQDSSNAGTATLVASGGSNGGGGGEIVFTGAASGGAVAVEIFGNGSLDVSGLNISALTIGSLEGDGLVLLGNRKLNIGINNLSTTFSGTIQNSGSIGKVGSATLTLSGASTYTGKTTVNEGTLVVSNISGSATGTGAVTVTAGTLGGSGTITGGVTIGTGGGTGAFLAPAHGTTKQSTLTIRSGLTFNANATYTYTFKARRNKSKTDKVVANGVTINSGATSNLSGTAQGILTQGTVLPVISNTAATPIAGSFSNLPDGAIVNVKGNNLQASYEGGDGNDLTLTVVP